MKNKVSLVVNQAQHIRMNKQMKESLDVLQMNIQDINRLIETELEENPVLESEPDEVDWLRYSQSVQGVSPGTPNEPAGSEASEELFAFPERITLTDHLEKEVAQLPLDRKEKRIADYIIERIDQNGYFLTDMTAAAHDLGIDEEALLSVLKKVQEIEPAGIAARDLEECLMLQVDPSEPLYREMTEIIKNDLEWIADKKYSAIRKKYALSLGDVQAIAEKIRLLNPRPGNHFSDFSPHYIIPDVIMEMSGEGFELTVNMKYHRLYISEFYKKLLGESTDDEVQRYIKEKLEKALMLIRNIEKRKRTVHIVSEEIVKYQVAFFTQKKAALRPMKLKDIAQKTGFHLSTISRAVRGKYILTPRGIFELKDLFSAALRMVGGKEISEKEIKGRIHGIIKAEDKAKPLSDQKICDVLNSDGIEIARRTVAKYRTVLGYSTASARKSKK